MPFYNTNKESPSEACNSTAKTQKQEVVILDFFKKQQQPQSPSMVHKAFFELWPITSVRRAMTDLTLAGELVKTKDTVPGAYGKREHLWALPGQQSLFSL
jgi:hypothetical protein